jgi:hypothetical protein
VAITYTTKTYTGALQAIGGTSSTRGGAGTVFQKIASATDGDVTIDNFGVSGNTTPQLAATTWTLANLTIKGKAEYVIPAGATTTVTTALILTDGKLTNNGTLTASAGSFSNTAAGTILTNNGSMSLPAATTLTNLTFNQNGTITNASSVSLTLGTGALWEVRNPDPAIALSLVANLTIQSGGTLGTLASASPQLLNLTFPGNLTIDSGGILHVNAKGFLGGVNDTNGSGPGASTGVDNPCTIQGGPGASYGGLGGAGGYRTVGAVYGSLSAPPDLGSGGTGGVVREITATSPMRSVTRAIIKGNLKLIPTKKGMVTINAIGIANPTELIFPVTLA